MDAGMMYKSDDSSSDSGKMFAEQNKTRKRSKRKPIIVVDTSSDEKENTRDSKGKRSDSWEAGLRDVQWPWLESKSSEQHVVVKYRKTLSDGLFEGIEHDRLSVWQEMGHECGMDSSEIYFPEKDGYQVVRIIKEGESLLTPVLESDGSGLFGFAIKDAIPEHTIMWQSPAEIVMKDFKQAVPVYCIPTTHGACHYSWKKLGSRTHFHRRLSFL